MRLLREAFFAVLLVVATNSPSSAQVVRLAWDAPTGPQFRSFSPSPIDVYVTVEGQSAPLQAVFVRLLVRSLPDCSFPPVIPPLPEAWRFAPGGCQAGRACVEGRAFEHLVTNPDPNGYQSISGFWDEDDQVVRTTAHAVFAELYGSVVQPDPNVRYVLAKFRFDHSLSVPDLSAVGGSCAGADQPVWIYVQASWLDEQGIEQVWSSSPYVLAWNSDRFARAEHEMLCNPVAETPPLAFTQAGGPMPGSLPICEAPVPARSSSWGAIKSNYR